jgi:hypothetical protein
MNFKMKGVFMKALITLVMSFFVGASAFANDFAAAVGFRSNSADSAAAVGTVDSKTGFGAGVIGFFDLGTNFQLRSGFLYNQRDVTGTLGTTEFDLNSSYVDIPVTAMYKFAEYGGAFIGPVLGLLASSECKSTVAGACTGLKKPDSTLLGLQFGVSFKFAPQLGGEFYYEMIPSEYWKDALKDAKTVGVNLLFTFE